MQVRTARMKESRAIIGAQRPLHWQSQRSLLPPARFARHGRPFRRTPSDVGTLPSLLCFRRGVPMYYLRPTRLRLHPDRFSPGGKNDPWHRFSVVSEKRWRSLHADRPEPAGIALIVANSGIRGPCGLLDRRPATYQAGGPPLDSEKTAWSLLNGSSRLRVVHTTRGGQDSIVKERKDNRLC